MDEKEFKDLVRKGAKTFNEWRRNNPNEEIDIASERFEGLNLEGFNLSELNLYGTDFSYANLKGANLERSNLRAAELKNANLRGASLAGSCLYTANLINANLEGANLKDTNFKQAAISGCSISWEELQHACLLDNIPVVDGLHRKVVDAIEDEEGEYWKQELDMSSWHSQIHSCNTTHCRAGWYVVIARMRHTEIEGILGTSVLAAAIALKSCSYLSRVPDFHCDNTTAMNDMELCARVEEEQS